MEEILSCQEFLNYCYDFSVKFWISFDEIEWNFNKSIDKNFIIHKECSTFPYFFFIYLIHSESRKPRNFCRLFVIFEVATVYFFQPIKEILHYDIVDGSEDVPHSDGLVFKTRVCKRSAPGNCSEWINNTLCSSLLLWSYHYQVCFGTNTRTRKLGANLTRNRNNKFCTDKMTMCFT